MMLVEDHRRRIARLLRGDRRVADLNCVFADLRIAKPGRESVKEIGHFAAHRGERDSGIVLKRASAMQTSARLWMQQIDGVTPTFGDIRAAGTANLAIAPPERIREGLRITPQAAKMLFRKAVDKMESGRPLNLKEREAVKVLGFSMMWQFAFDERTLVADLCDLLIGEGSLELDRRGDLERHTTFVALYALALMHGARLKLPDGSLAPLRLAAREETGTLRIKAEIPVPSMGKPVTSSVPMFETALMATEHCDPGLLEKSEINTPLEVDGDRVVALA
jgi:hypothetical protein